MRWFHSRLPTESIGDAVGSYTEEPGRDLFYRLQQTVRCDELVEHVLENILYVILVGQAAPDEVSEPTLFTLYRRDDLSVLLSSHPSLAQ